LPIKDRNNKAIFKNKIKWTPSSKNKKLVDWKITKDNPLQKLEIKKITNEREIKYWKNTDDIKKIIDASSGCWKTINILGFYIGTRISEALNADFNFVDFDNHTIKIQSSGTFRTKSRKFRIIKMPQYRV
jgi:integrase